MRKPPRSPLAAIFAVLLAASAAGAWASAAAASTSKWRGNHKPCKVHLHDTSDYRTVPLPSNQVHDYVFYWTVQGHVRWDDPRYRNNGSLKFRTCPPKRVLVIGDSIPFSLGVPWLNHETDYGVELADAPILGCTFGDRGVFYNRGDKPQPLPAGCVTAYQEWSKAADRFHAQAVIVEMGLRSEFDWSWNKRRVHLGQTEFDSFVKDNIESLIQTMGTHGRKILFLTVPYIETRYWPNGKQDPSSTRSRHRAINTLIRAVANRHRRNVEVYDIDKIISPGNHYNTYVHGTFCRWDGVHFTTDCADMLEPHVLGATRELLRK